MAMINGVSLGVCVPGTGNVRFDDLKRIWIEAEELGFDAGYIWNNITCEVPTFQEDACFEGWTTLAALAAVTSRIDLGMLLNPAGRVHPSVVAKMGANVDYISGGRLIMGMGTGTSTKVLSQMSEVSPEAARATEIERAGNYIAYGFPVLSTPETIAMLREEVAIVERMWTQDRPTFEGEYYSIDRPILSHKPVQKPRPRIWIGIIEGRRLMPRLAAEVSDGIALANSSDKACREIIEATERRCTELGRDFGRFGVNRQFYVNFPELSGIKVEGGRYFESSFLGRGLTDEQRTVFRGIGESEYGFGGVEGTSEEVAAGLKESCLDIGVNSLALIFTGLDRDFEAPSLAPLEKFAKEVVPILNEYVS